MSAITGTLSTAMRRALRDLQSRALATGRSHPSLNLCGDMSVRVRPASLDIRHGTLRMSKWRCLCVFRICSIMSLTPQGSCKLTEGIPLSWVFQRTLCQITLPSPQMERSTPSARPGDVTASLLSPTQEQADYTGVNVGHGFQGYKNDVCRWGSMRMWRTTFLHFSVNAAGQCLQDVTAPSVVV